MWRNQTLWSMVRAALYRVKREISLASTIMDKVDKETLLWILPLEIILSFLYLLGSVIVNEPFHVVYWLEKLYR